MKMNLFKNRKFKHGSLSTIIIILFIVAILIVNVIFTVVLKKYPLTIDLSPDNRFGITNASVDYLKTINTPVTIYITSKENEFESLNQIYKQAYEVITSYTKYNSNIKIEFIDLLNNPTFAQKYPTEVISEKDIIVQTEKRYKKFASYELFVEKQYEETTQISSKAEQVLTSAIMYALDENPIKVVCLNDAKTKLADYIDLLSKNNYEIVYRNLLTEDIDKDAAIVVLPPLTNDLAEAELTKLDKFLTIEDKDPKSLIYVAGYDTPSYSNFDEFLAEWGLKINPGIIAETNTNNAITNAFTVINVLDNETYTNNLKNKIYPFVTSFTHPIETLFESTGNRKTHSVAKTYETAVVVDPNEETVDYTTKKQQAYNTIAAGTRHTYEGQTQINSTVMVFGSEMSLNKNFLQYASMNNGDLTANISTVLANKKDAITIVPIDFGINLITVSESSKQIFTIVFMFIIPIGVLLFGMIIWLRRRHK